MLRFFACVACVAGVAWLGVLLGARPQDKAPPLTVGFGEQDITPTLEGKPVYMAGFGQNRKATRIHDPLFARAVVLSDGKAKVAVVSVDLVGLFLKSVDAVRQRLPGFTHIVVSSTHNHEGPDTLGLWGSGPFTSGINKDYQQKVEDGIVAAIQNADKARQPASARIGVAAAPELLHDGRLPIVKHDELVALDFKGQDGKLAGIVVQWNCHPETLSSKNTEISADYVGYTIKHLRDKHGCPVVYLTGTVGGLMTSLHVEVKDAAGKNLEDGTFEKTERYGVLVGQLADRALAAAKPLSLTPIEARARELFIPLANKTYVAGWQIGLLDRQAYLWTGDPYKAEPLKTRKLEPGQVPALRSEVGYLRLGDLEVALIPGEIYPELVLGKVENPADPGADFPMAAIEPSIYGQLKGPHRMLIGLANDEVGYILPKRQWDEVAPFCYGRKTAQYGEVNSCGPETGPLICEAFRAVVKGGK